MRSFLIAAAFIAAAAAATDDASSSSSPESSSSTLSIAKSTFTPSTIKAPFLEQFTDNWTSRWKPSHAKIEKKASEVEEWAYVGNWAVEEPFDFNGIEQDKGLVVKDKAAHHAISAKFDKAINTKGKPLVVQYEVKLQDGLECGGAYMKLLQENKKLHLDEFSNASPYVIMFGPDKCGATNKVHFIFRHKNLKTGEYEEKHFNNPPTISSNRLTSIYQLIVNPDNTFSISIDGKESKSGSLLEDFTPSVNPVKEIDDPKDKKPQDWIDEARMADPDATKPSDWDEDAPLQIPNDEASQPGDWLEDEPTMIADPEAERPEDWDDEEDGDWVAPQVPNPKCADVSGCGEWKRPNKKNPEHKGKWTAPFIDNPAYKGVWAPRKIANPDYYEDKTPANFEPMGAIGFELWTMQNNIMFDNIYIGHSIEDAEALKQETWDVKIAAEREHADLAANKLMEEREDEVVDLKKDPVKYVMQKVLAFVEAAKKDPVAAVKAVPEVAGAIGVSFLAIIVLLVSLLSPAAPSKEDMKKAAAKVKATAEKAKTTAEQVKENVAEAVATGAENVKEASKRTTRSSQS